MEDTSKTTTPWRPRRLGPGEAIERDRIADAFPGGALGIPLKGFSSNPRIGRHRLFLESIARNSSAVSDSKVLVAISAGAPPQTHRAVLGMRLGFARRLIDTALGRDNASSDECLSSGEQGALLYILDRISGDWIAAGGPRFAMRGFLCDGDQIADYLGIAPDWQVRARIAGDELEGALKLCFSHPGECAINLHACEDVVKRAASWPVVFSISSGWSRLKTGDVANLGKGDLVHLDESGRPGDGGGYLTVGSGTWLRHCRWLDRRRIEVVADSTGEVDMDTKVKGDREVAVELDHSIGRDTGSMEVVVRVEVGEVKMTVEKAAGLVPGRVIRLDREVGSSVVLKVGDKLIGRGELVEHEGSLAVEVMEVL